MNDKIKIAVLDSGLNTKHEMFQNVQFYGGTFTNDGKFIENIMEDENGHGTACVSTIIKECSSVELYIYKILNAELMTSLNVLEKALEIIIDSDIRIINLSLSIIEHTKLEDLKKICDQLYQQGKIIICALGNGQKRSYPANFRSTIGVRGFILENSKDYWFSMKNGGKAIVDDEPYMHLGLKENFFLYGKCNSYAAAKMTGIVASNLLYNQDFSYAKLMKNASRNNWHDLSLLKSKRFSKFDPSTQINKQLLTEVEKITGAYLKLEDTSILYQSSLFDSKVGLTYENAYGLMRILEQEIKFKVFDYTNVSRSDMYSIYNLASLVEKYIRS